MRTLRSVYVVAALALLAAGCGLQDGFNERSAGEPATTPGSTTPATTAPPATVPAAAPVAVPPAGLGVGDQGEPVLAVEQRLEALRYFVGSVDDVFDADTGYGVTAFQKVNGMEKSGRVTPDVAERLAAAQPPPPIVADGGPSRVEIDLPRQVLFLYQGGALDTILNVSTGNGEDYCHEEGCGTAVTPPGTYAAHYHVDGWDESPLGQLYNPVYFDPKAGLAIHGFADVPADPASHGCVRISMTAAEWFPDKATKGTPVYVSDGQTPLQPAGPVPA